MKDHQLPKTRLELEEREAAGFWQAIGLVNRTSKHKDRAVDVAMICHIHRTIFCDVDPTIAGRFRSPGEDIKKLHYLTPPLGARVLSAMDQFGKELAARLGELPERPKTTRAATLHKWVRKVVEVAAWAQHGIVAIHPFANGNGRTARLFTNLILQHHGLTGSRIKFEQEDKQAYLNALAQADKVGDYEPLQKIVLKAMEDQYRFMINQRKAFRRKA